MGRYELKYFLDRRLMESFVTHIQTFCEPDQNSQQGRYQVNSLYFDSDSLRFFYENADGIRYRKKLRLRHYGDFSKAQARFFEIKQKNNRSVSKKRVPMALEEKWEAWSHLEQEPASSPTDIWRQEILFLMNTLNLQPRVYTIYQRFAYLAKEEHRLRVTVDYDLKGCIYDEDMQDDSKALDILSPEFCIVELKGNSRLPYWLTEVVRDYRLHRTRISKYCNAIRRCYSPPRKVAIHV